MINKFKVSIALMIGISLLHIGCTARVAHRGKLPDAEQIAKIKPGVQDKEEVLRLIGSPSSISTFNDNTWIYDYKVTESKAFFDATEIMHRMYVIQFDLKGKVKEIINQDGHGHNIQPVRRSTPSPGDDRTFMQTIFGNFGKRAQKLDSDGKSKDE